jgi:hypothetical protein
MRRVIVVMFAGWAACGGGDAAPDAAGPDARPVDLSCLDAANLTAVERQLINQPADSWAMLPGTALDPWCRTQGLPENGEPTAFRCGNVILSWGGGAFDPSRRQLVLFGGGHNDYAGNEVYGFDLATAAWQRLRAPTPMAQVIPSADAYADGAPVSRHTYDGFAYLTDRAQLLTFGGSRYQDGSSTPVTWLLDSGSNAWTRKSDFPPSGGGIFYTGTDYDEATHTVYTRTQDGIFTYDVPGDAWRLELDAGYPPYYPEFTTGNYRRGVVLASRRLFYTIGGKTQSGKPDVLVWDLAAHADATAAWALAGDTSGLSADGPGADYDRAGDAIVTWAGGAPNILDLGTKQWRRGSATGAPAMPSEHGTYGRWRYVAYLNAFVLVNGPTEDVYVYKHTGGCGAT